MAFEPKVGCVIRFDFLWKDDQLKGREQGKDRPCAIILASKAQKDGSRTVVLCPITHSPPRKGESGVEIPHKVGRHLNLDDDRSWIKTHQVNTVRWEKDRLPYGVTPARKGQWEFGELPRDLGKQAFEQVRERIKTRSMETVRRDDEKGKAPPQRPRSPKSRDQKKDRDKDR